MTPAFRKRDTFIHGRHPASTLLLALSLMTLSLITANPFGQLAIILACAILALSAGVFKAWLLWWKICLIVFLATLIINTLVSRHGASVIWRGPGVPALGHLFITGEALAYGAGMGLRLAAVIWVFALVTLTVDPDSVLGLLKGRGSRSALLSALSMRMVPTMARDAGDILDAQRARGVALDQGGKWAVLKSRLPLVKRVFTTALDRGIGLAEAMESRAYGSGRRTRYREYGFGPGDLAVVGASIFVLGAGIAGLAAGTTSFDYYPSISMAFGAATPAMLLAPVLAALALLLLSYLWKRSNWLRLRT
jgi:energy-coupling factor transport system permease protein